MLITDMGEKIVERLSEELGKMRREMRQREEEWKEERRELGKKMQELEKRIEEMEGRLERRGKDEAGEGKVGWYRGEERTVVERVKDIGRRLELKERKERRNNVLIRRLEGGGGGVKGRVEKIFEEIGAKVEIEWIRKVGGREGGEDEMVVVKLGNREQKRQVMERKKGLRGSKVRIEDDLTWEERKIKWKIREIAEEERNKGSRVWTGYGKIKINEIWWRWDEERGELRDWRGESRKEVGENKGERQ